MASVELDSEFMRMQLADLSIVLTNERQAGMTMTSALTMVTRHLVGEKWRSK